MIELGIFAKVFPAGPPDRVAGMIRDAGFSCTQLNLSALGRPTLDPSLTTAEAASIGAAFAAAGVRMWSVSGTFNAIHPDATQRAAGIEGCLANIASAGAMGAQVVTLCTGSRDPHDQWRAHPDNDAPAAWHDLRATLEALIPAAAAAEVRLGIEPEPGNVIRDTRTAVRLFDELGSDARQLAVVLDPANLLTVATLSGQRRILEEAFAQLGEHTAGVHAKDVTAGGRAAAGTGGLDYDLVMRLHAALPRPVPVIAQDLKADDAPRVAAFLRQHALRAAS